MFSFARTHVRASSRAYRLHAQLPLPAAQIRDESGVPDILMRKQVHARMTFCARLRVGVCVQLTSLWLEGSVANDVHVHVDVASLTLCLSPGMYLSFCLSLFPLLVAMATGVPLSA
eukprot:4941422-Pleurochrysis_carterae.AAC.1